MKRKKDPEWVIDSLGAGVQSTTMLLMAEAGELERPDCAIFADTGWEPKNVYEHLERLKEAVTIPIHIVRNESARSVGNIREDHIRASRGEVSGLSQMPMYSDAGKIGNSPLMRSCTADYKVAPIEKKLRALIGLKPRQRAPKAVVVIQRFGITTDEAQRMRLSGKAWIENAYPLIDLRMSRHDCNKWLEKHGWEVPKSACIGCPFHNDRMWRRIKDHDPESWEDAVQFDKDIRNEKKLPGVKGNVFLHGSRQPLDEVDLSTAEDHGQMSFLDECEGMCGV
jgi:hypothetical protein